MAARPPLCAEGIEEKAVPPRPFSAWVLPSLAVWARYDSNAADVPTLITLIPPLRSGSAHPQPLGSLVRFADGPRTIRASSTVTAEQIGTAWPARHVIVSSTIANNLIMRRFSLT